MTLALPRPIAAYLTADKEGGKAVAQCFTETAVVKDEGHTYHGWAAIKRWKSPLESRTVAEPVAAPLNWMVTVERSLSITVPDSKTVCPWSGKRVALKAVI